MVCYRAGEDERGEPIGEKATVNCSSHMVKRGRRTSPPSTGRRRSTCPGMQGAMRSKAWGEDAACVAGSLLGRGEDEIRRSTYLFFGKMGTEEGSAGTGGHSGEDWGWGGDAADPGQSAS